VFLNTAVPYQPHGSIQGKTPHLARSRLYRKVDIRRTAITLEYQASHSCLPFTKHKNA